MCICAEQLHAQLCAMAEPSFAAFTRKLMPGVEGVLGVRLPKLRKLAKQIAKGDWRAYLRQAQDTSYEEIMLQGMVIGYAPIPDDEVFDVVRWFVPKIDNWSVCDSFCITWKYAKAHPEAVFDFLQPFLQAQDAFAVRFAVVMLLDYYAQLDWLPRVFDALDTVTHPDYYVRMAVAWAISMCCAADPEQTLLYLQRNTWEDFTHHKAIQKILESRQIAQDYKQRARALRRHGQR